MSASDIEEAKAQVEAAERSLAEAKRLLAQSSKDLCAFKCCEFETVATGAHLSVIPRQRWQDGRLRLSQSEAVELRRILTAFIGDGGDRQ